MPKSNLRRHVHGPTPRRDLRLAPPIARALLVAALLSSSVAYTQSTPPPLDVVATVGMAADVVREVGGPCVDVTVLMGPGIDPHLYRASAGDVTRLGQAELIVYNGFNLEGQLGAILDRIGARVSTLALAEGIAATVDEAAMLAGDDAYSGQADPHLWGDASLWAHGAAVVAERLSGLRPDCGDELAERAATYRSQLEALHAWAEASVATIPAGQRTLLTSHDAFEYFGAAYGLEVAGIEGISTESEASIADIRDATELVIESGVRAIFVETTISPRTIEAVQAAVRDRGGEVAIGGALFGDAMGERGSPEGTYVGMIRHNVRVIVAALGGQLAPWPEALASWAEAWALE